MLFLYAGDQQYESDTLKALEQANLRDQFSLLERVEDLEGALTSFKRPRWFGDAQKALIVLDLDHSAEGPQDTVEAVIRQVRGNELYKGIPVIVLGGTLNPADVAFYYGLGVNACVKRPMETDALSEVFDALRSFWLERSILPEGGK